MNPYNVLKEKGLITDNSLPPAERLDHVLPIEISKGCSYGKCLFCSEYSKSGVEDLEKFQGLIQIDKTMRALVEKVGPIEDVKRPLSNLERMVFTGGNPLRQDYELLNEFIQHAARAFFFKSGNVPRRTGMYGRVQDILDKGEYELAYLSCGGTCQTECSSRFLKNQTLSRDKIIKLNHPKMGLDLVHTGLESGSNVILDMLKKGHTFEEAAEAMEMLKNVGIRSAVTVMAGVGGREYAREHLDKTSELLNLCEPDFVTIMGISPTIAYSNEMRKLGITPVNDDELKAQTNELKDNIGFHTIVGCFDASVDAVGYNPAPFGSVELNVGKKLSEYDRDTLNHDVTDYKYDLFDEGNEDSMPGNGSFAGTSMMKALSALSSIVMPESRRRLLRRSLSENLEGMMMGSSGMSIGKPIIISSPEDLTDDMPEELKRMVFRDFGM
jgi:hypothetical protein